MWAADARKIRRRKKQIRLKSESKYSILELTCLDKSLFEFGSSTSQIKIEQYFMFDNIQIQYKRSFKFGTANK